jgi:two-component system, chemotaxis family, protein-glutamate methylesterase/glutaminase
MPDRIVVIGASAGGIDALRLLTAGLPPDFPSPIVVVLHMSPESPGILHDILDRSGPLRASTVRDGERLEAGRIFVAPPDRHVLLEPGKLHLTRGPRENRFRPAIDPLFRTAAQVYGPAAIGVILTGNLDDGTAGLWAIKKMGGTAIVQDPADAMFPAMPANARRHIKVDHCVPLAAIAPLLVRLTAAPVDEYAVALPEHTHVDIKIAREEDPLEAGLRQVTEPSSIACPECHGVLMQLKEEGRIRFRCHTGHAYSADSLVAEISEGIEEALWIAIRSMQEGGMLMRQLVEHHTVAAIPGDAEALKERAAALDRQADALRALVTDGDGFSVKGTSFASGRRG